MTPLTEHFSVEELTLSQVAMRKGIDNSPPIALLPVLADTAQRLELVRSLFGAPIHISSGYRSTAVNWLVGGVPDSAHITGYAVDFTVEGWDNLEVAERIVASSLEFDQCILEYGWIHISFDPRMRRQVMTKKSQYAAYQAGLVA